MTPIAIASLIASSLLLISRFVQSAKPIWERYVPRPVAILIPPVLALVQPVIDLISQTRTWEDLIGYLLAAASMLMVGLFPRPATPVAEPL